MLVNTEEFRRDAIYYQKHKRYDDGEFDTPYWHEFWDEQDNRCIEGYTVGGVKISGYYYHYLNFCPIWLVRIKDYGTFTKNKPLNARKAGERVETFPDFWDEDYRFFTCLDIAEFGITFEEYDALPVDLGLIRDEDNFTGGHHMTWLKPRGVGASYKGGSLPARNYNCIKGSKSYMFAFESEYLNKDGIVNKFLMYKDFVSEHAIGLSGESDFKNDNTKMIYRNSVTHPITGKETGMMSEVYGISLKDNTDKGRGKRGKVIVVEESGKFPGLADVIDKARPSVEEVDVNFGTIVAFGTGGSEKNESLFGLRSLFYNPVANNMLRFRNSYDPGMSESECGLFTPSTKNPQYKDKHGNSQESVVKAQRDKARKDAEASSDPMKLSREKAENPFNPEEALLDHRANPFVSEELIRHKKEVEKSGRALAVPARGTLHWIGPPRDQKAKFKVDTTLQPNFRFPYKRNADNTGCVLIYETPYEMNGVIPPFLYTVNVDAYRFDESTGDSVGAIYVIKSPNNFTTDRGGTIAASYIGRPEEQEDFNRILFQLSCMYNAKIAFENDEPGDIIGFAKRNKMIHRLQEEFQMAYDDTLVSKGAKRKFGVKIASGRENARKKQGDIYLKNWLYEIRFVDSTGKEWCNFHMINDLGLLRELCNYNLDGNFDRISAMRVSVLFIQELLYDELLPKKPSRVNDPYSLNNTKLYSDYGSNSTETTSPVISER